MVDLSQRREGRWVPIEANGNGVECFVPLVPPSMPPSTTNLSSLSSSSNPDPLRQHIYSAGYATNH